MLRIRIFDPVNLQISYDGIRADGEYLICSVANGRYIGGGIPICPDADPADEKLNLANATATFADGSDITPIPFEAGTVYTPIEIWYGGSRLEEGVDYEISYTQNDQLGTASFTATVTGAVRVFAIATATRRWPLTARRVVCSSCALRANRDSSVRRYRSPCVWADTSATTAAGRGVRRM